MNIKLINKKLNSVKHVLSFHCNNFCELCNDVIRRQHNERSLVFVIRLKISNKNFNKLRKNNLETKIRIRVNLLIT